MGEMSEYFEDFPEENPANYVGDRFDPEGAERLRAEKAREKAKLEREQAALDAEIRSVIEKARQSAKQNKKED